jgi:hypothetical protein
MLAVLKLLLFLQNPMIGTEGTRLLREAPRTARGKRSAWSVNLQKIYQSPFYIAAASKIKLTAIFYELNSYP